MGDYTTAHWSTEYDNEILATIPSYDAFHHSAVDVIQTAGKAVNKWLDTGCGTGNLYMNAAKIFIDTEFTLADPSREMLQIAKEKIETDKKIIYVNADSQGLDYEDNTFDVITAIQCHHYLGKDARKQAVQNCFRMLKPGGLFVTFENIMPLSEDGMKLSLKRWKEYQIRNGKPPFEAEQHIKRFGKAYFPISIVGHIDLLNEVGFHSSEILWVSYMQAGFYAIK